MSSEFPTSSKIELFSLYCGLFHFLTFPLTSVLLGLVILPYYTVNHKKRDILFLTITLANLDQFLPRCMECSRGIAMGILSVRLSVHPSVCQTRAL